VPTVAVDARDARAAQLRGWGRHARDLLAALHARDDVEVVEHAGGGRLPELAWEQVLWPARLVRERPDVAHAPNCFLPVARPCPGVVTVHDLAFEAFPGDFAPRTGWKYRTFTRAAVRSAQRVIAVSQFTAADLVERYGCDPAKIRVVHNGPSLPLGDAPAPDGPPYLLAVGDLRAKKNLGRLVEAFAALREDELRGWRLVLAGLGDAPRAPGVEATGWVGDVELDALVRGAGCLVHPSLYEGFGLVLVEAMARGTPVAAARATALPEVGGEACEWFDPLDVEDLAAAVLRALARREELAALGRARAARFSWARAAAETVEVYRECA
jgi:glycosyltransferase involved in cell wall biosynthesis